jgi:hypothetical protein
MFALSWQTKSSRIIPVKPSNILITDRRLNKNSFALQRVFNRFTPTDFDVKSSDVLVEKNLLDYVFCTPFKKKFRSFLSE